MSHVIQPINDVLKPINANAIIKNGYAVTGADKRGNHYSVSHNTLPRTSLSGIYTQLKDRYDDLDYSFQILVHSG